ncbi:MAG: tetratricopeptide repeat protein [Candidatus Thorarchaeota archaeon]
MTRRRPELFQHVIDPYIVLHEAWEFMQRGDLSNAEQTLRPSISIDFRTFEEEHARGKKLIVFEYHPLLWDLLADVMKKKGDKSAYDHAKRMVQLCETRLEEIKEVVEEDTEFYGSDTSRWFEAARALHSAGFAAEALGCLKKAHHIEPNNSEISTAFLISLSNAKFYSMAEELANNIIKNGTTEPIIKQMLGISLLFQKKYHEAIPVLEDISRAKPNDGPNWQLLSIAYGNLEQYRDAAESLRKMIRVNYEVERARRVLEEIESIKVDIPIMSDYTISVKTAAAVEKSDDDSVLSQDEIFMLSQLLREGATSKKKGLTLGGGPNSWDVAIVLNLVAKGFAVFTSDKNAYLTEKGLKRIKEIQK